MCHVGNKWNELPTVLGRDRNAGYDDITGRSVDNLRRAGVNFSTFVYDERQCNRNRDRENLCDFPMRIVGAVSIRLVDGVGIDLRAAVYFRKPTEEFGIFARRFSGEDECFAVGLLRCLCVSIAEIPCDRIAIGGKLCVERLCRCDAVALGLDPDGPVGQRS